jgi:hypothetical protein
LTSQQESADDVLAMEQGALLIARKEGHVQVSFELATQVAEARKKAYHVVRAQGGVLLQALLASVDTQDRLATMQAGCTGRGWR